MGKEQLIPSKEVGKNNEVGSNMTMDNEAAAKDLFVRAAERLLAPGSWEQAAGKMGAEFTLFNADKNESGGPASEGDYIRINLPGPGSSKGDGYDWVEIKQIESSGGVDRNDTQRQAAYIGMKVKPCSNPFSPDDDTAHFFDDDSSSTFLIEMDGVEVRARYFGRNERPNTDVSSMLDKMRNAVVSVIAFAGISELQWKSLLDGWLEK